MDVSTMRTVDRYLGLPLCIALTLVRQILDPRRPSASAPSKIAFVKLAEQGSTVLAWSAIENAARRVGRENVYFVLFEQNRYILDAVSWIPESNIIAIRADRLTSIATSGWAAIRRLRSAGVDVAIDLEFFARASVLLAYLSGASSRIGFHPFAGAARYRGNLLTHRVSYNPYVHIAQAFELLVDALDEPSRTLPAYNRVPETAAVPPLWTAAPSHVNAMQQLVTALGGTAGPIVLLNPNAGDLIWQRRWPVERYVDLARRLLVELPAALILVTGAPNEAESMERLVREINSPRCISVAGRTSVADLLALYSLGDVLITNDSGPAHFASLTPIDIIALFGPETPLLFGSLSPRTHVLWAGLSCSPCLNAFNNRMSACTDNVCMQRIPVDTVLATTIELLATRANGRQRPGPSSGLQSS